MKLKKERVVRGGKNLVQILREGTVLAEIPEELIDDVFPVFQDEEDKLAKNDTQFVELFRTEWEKTRTKVMQLATQEQLAKIKIVKVQR